MLDTVRATLQMIPLEGEKIVVAVSGGVDSLVMLVTLHHLQPEFGYTLHVATFDHGLREAAGSADVTYVREFATALGLPVTSGQAQGLTGNLEAAARRARYTFLLETAQTETAYFIALGHHRDDQVETVLLHMLRGTGLAGLRGMLPEAPLSASHLVYEIDDALLDYADSVTIIRPLLNVTRAEIRDFAADNQIVGQEDATNQDTRLLRNRLRHEVIPLLENFNPHLREGLSRLAYIVQGDYAVIQAQVNDAMLRLVEWEEVAEGDMAYMDRHEFSLEPRAIKRYVIRQIIADLTGETEAPYTQIENACSFIADAQTGQQMSLPGDLRLSIGYDECLFHFPGDEVPYPRHLPHLRQGKVVPLDAEGEFKSDGLRFYSYWVYEGKSKAVIHDDPLQATLAIPPDAELSLRTRRPGDRFAPMGLGGHSQKLSDAFTNLKVPASLRDRVPLLTINGEIAWFVAPTASGVQGRIAEKFAVRGEDQSLLRVRWEQVNNVEADD